MAAAALPRVWAAFESHPHSVDLQLAAVTVLWNVSEGRAVQGAVVASDGARRVLQAMQRFPGHIDLQVACSGVVTNVAASFADEVCVPEKRLVLPHVLLVGVIPTRLPRKQTAF